MKNKKNEISIKILFLGCLMILLACNIKVANSTELNSTSINQTCSNCTQPNSDYNNTSYEPTDLSGAIIYLQTWGVWNAHPKPAKFLFNETADSFKIFFTKSGSTDMFVGKRINLDPGQTITVIFKYRASFAFGATTSPLAVGLSNGLGMINPGAFKEVSLAADGQWHDYQVYLKPTTSVSYFEFYDGVFNNVSAGDYYEVSDVIITKNRSIINHINCSDSDSGLNYDVPGTAIGIYSEGDVTKHFIFGTPTYQPGVSVIEGAGESINYDYCGTSTQLNEGYCDANGKLSSVSYNCPNGCGNGICLSASIPPQANCSPNYLCSGSNSAYQSNNCTISIISTCSHGCRDGFCVQQNSTSSNQTQLPNNNQTTGFNIWAVWSDKPIYIIGEDIKIQAKIVGNDGNILIPEEGATVQLLLQNTERGLSVGIFTMNFNKDTNYYESVLQGILYSGKWRANVSATNNSTHFVTNSMLLFTITPVINQSNLNQTIQARVWSSKDIYLTGENIDMYAQVIDGNGNTITPQEGIKAEITISQLFQGENNSEKCGDVDNKCNGVTASYQLSYNEETKHYEKTTRPLSKGIWHLDLQVKQNNTVVAQDGDIFEVKTHAAETNITNSIKDEETTIRDKELYSFESCKDGCLKESVCLPFGTRVLNGEPKFCNITKNWEIQKNKDYVCQNNYECESNQCSNGKCINLQDDLKETQGLLQRLLAWFDKIFGGKQ